MQYGSWEGYVSWKRKVQYASWERTIPRMFPLILGVDLWIDKERKGSSGRHPSLVTLAVSDYS